jgi:hypothetical protein
MLLFTTIFLACILLVILIFHLKKTGLLNIRKRFKKALFAFFKDEIISAIGGEIPARPGVIVNKNLRFEEIRASITFPHDDYEKGNLPSSSRYEQALTSAKVTIFAEVMKFVVVDKDSVLNDNFHHPERKIELSILVASKKQ